MKRLFSCFLVFVLCLAVTNVVFAASVTDADVELGTSTNKLFTIDSVDVYAYPAKAADLFHVTEIIYFVHPNVASNNFFAKNNTVILVKSMDELISVAAVHPFAAIVIAESAAPLLEDKLLIDLAQNQHIVLIKEEEAQTDSRSFSAYYVDSVNKKINKWSPVPQNIDSLHELLEFADITKHELYYVYDVIVDSPLAEAPEESIICQYSLNGTLLYANDAYNCANMPRADWDPADNNEVRLFRPFLADQRVLSIYSATSGGTRLMRVYEGEAVLYTGETRRVGDFTWHQVRGWKVEGNTVSLIQGWAQNWYSDNYSVTDFGTGCERLYDYANMLTSTHWTIHSTRGAGFSTKSTTNLYNSAGTQLLSLPAGSIVWVTNEEGYAGYSNPHYFSISGYTKNGTYTSCSSTTFVNAGFNTGTPSTYKIYTTVE